MSGERRGKAISIAHNQKSTPSHGGGRDKARSKSCIEKFFSGKSKAQPQEHVAKDPKESHQNVPTDGKRGRSIVLEIKQLKREIHEEIRQ